MAAVALIIAQPLCVWCLPKVGHFAFGIQDSELSVQLSAFGFLDEPKRRGRESGNFLLSESMLFSVVVVVVVVYILKLAERSLNSTQVAKKQKERENESERKRSESETLLMSLLLLLLLAVLLCNVCEKRAVSLYFATCISSLRSLSRFKLALNAPSLTYSVNSDTRSWFVSVCKQRTLERERETEKVLGDISVRVSASRAAS